MEWRLGFALLFGVAFIFLLFLVGAALPPEGRAVQILESIVFTPGGMVTDWIGIGGHDLLSYPIVILVDIGLYSIIGFGLILAWKRRKIK
jgi:hypothetical protein